MVCNSSQERVVSVSFCAIFSSTSSLPSTIDPILALAALRARRDGLQNLLQHCLLEMANYLLADFLVPGQLYDKVVNDYLNPTERVLALLDCVESRIEVVPSDFIKFVRILEEVLPLEPLAKDLVQSYCSE